MQHTSLELELLRLVQDFLHAAERGVASTALLDRARTVLLIGAGYPFMFREPAPSPSLSPALPPAPSPAPSEPKEPRNRARHHGGLRKEVEQFVMSRTGVTNAELRAEYGESSSLAARMLIQMGWRRQASGGHRPGRLIVYTKNGATT